MRPVPEITAEQENARFEPLASGPGFNAITTRVDPVEPVPVGTYIVQVFRVTGYDPDCDGSLMARLAAVDREGRETGWEPTHLALYPDTALIIESPGELWASPDEPGGSQGRAGVIARWLCRFGLHYYGTMWQNIAPASSGGPSWVRQRCLRCFHEKMERNWR